MLIRSSPRSQAFRSSAAAAFELFPAAAWTGRTSGCGFQCVLPVGLPQVGRAPGKFVGPGFDMLQQHFPGNTIFTLTVEFPRSTHSMSRAVGITKGLPAAVFAPMRNIRFQVCEFLAQGIGQNGFQGILADIAYLPGRIHIKITGVTIAVVLHHDVRITDLIPAA